MKIFMRVFVLALFVGASHGLYINDDATDIDVVSWWRGGSPGP